MGRQRIFIGTASILLCGFASGQSGTNDDTFSAGDQGFGLGDGPNRSISAIAIQPDGRTVISGDFTAYNGVARRGIARLNADGSLDATFDPGTGFDLYWGSKQLVLQADGKIIAIGNFEAFDGNDAHGIVRLTADGAFDATFDIGSGFDDDPDAVALQDDGKILVAGPFTTYNGVVKPQMLRLESTGQLDPTFDIGVGMTPPQFGQVYVTGIQVMPDGRIVLGGSMTSYNGSTCNDLIRLNANGTLDVAFGTGNSIYDVVRAFTLLPDGGVVFALDRVLRQVNSDGTLAAPLNMGSGFDEGWIRNLVRQPDGRLIVQGSFTSFNGVTRRALARLEQDGNLDASFVPPVALTYFSYGDAALALAADGKVLVGGEDELLSGTGKNYLARLTSTGSMDDSFNPGTGCSDEVVALAVQPDGNIIAGGRFAYFNGVRCNYLVRLLPDGTVDPSFQPAAGFNRAVTAVVVQPDGKLLVGGNFYTANGPRVIARLNADGSVDSTFSPPEELLNLNPGNLIYYDWVKDLILQPDGRILVNGQLIAAMRLNADGSSDETFVPGASGTSMALQSDGKLLIGLSDIKRLNIDGSVDPTFNGTLNGPPMTPIANGIWTLADGKAIIVGDFTAYMGTPCSEVIRVNADGSLDDSFQVPAGLQVRTLIVRPNGQLLCAGVIGDPFQASTLFLLNEDGSVDLSLGVDALVGFEGSGSWGKVSALAEQADGKLIVGGGFVQYNGTGRNRLARLNADFSTDISEQAPASLEVYPNPSAGRYFIDLPDIHLQELSVVDLTGRVVLAQRLELDRPGRVAIDLSARPDGAYLLRVRSDKGTSTERLVKQ